MSGRSDIRLAADIGGTFTDVVLDVGVTRVSRKVLTTPARPEIGLLQGLDETLTAAGVTFGDVSIFVHGTTLATNAIIERRGARTALITTHGFRDVLTIATEGRFNQYDLMIEKPTQLVHPEQCYTLAERIDSQGRIHLALDDAEVRELAKQIHDDGIESVAICFLQSFINPVHEQRVAEILAELLPDVPVSLSHEVCPEMREYERASTTVANAYVRPLMDGYLRRAEAELTRRGFGGVMYMMTSGGGLTTVEGARRYPVRLVESGPAGGAIFAGEVAVRAGESRVLSFDMGGTTAKISLIKDGVPATARTFEVDRAARFMRGSGLPLRIPVIEMVEIGAGGGSIARVDELKRVIIGPESASSTPGPVCYDRGGLKPTVTDADLLLGLLKAEGFADGTMTLNPGNTRKAIAEQIGKPLDIDENMGAYAIYEMVCENMASAARVHAAETGFDAERSTMIAFGGAAPLHAARVAEKIGIRRILIPRNAGVGSAIGFLSAPVAFEVLRSKITRFDHSFAAGEVKAMLDEMIAHATEIVERGAAGQSVAVRVQAYMRYVGQGHEIPVDLDIEQINETALATVRERFENEYRALFGRSIPRAAVEAVTWSVTASTPTIKPAFSETAAPTAEAVATGHRKLFDGRTQKFVELPAYRRSDLSPSVRVSGPAIIEEAETSTYVPAAFDARPDNSGNLVLERKDQ